MALAAREAAGNGPQLISFGDLLKSTRPTAVNLAWAVDRQVKQLLALPPSAWENAAREMARLICDEDAAACRQIGRHGLEIIHRLRQNQPPDRPFQILTHCNAGWLAFVDHGSATAPIYAAHAAGLPIHVWVDETRPRNQGARLTAWELGQHGVPHTVIVDNAGGHLMQRGQVDLVIVGADRVTRTGDVANKIGTYLKALAARDNGIPFYVALPSSTFDWSLRDGLTEIPIEERSSREVSHLSGIADGIDHSIETEIALLPAGTSAANPSFDVTPARLVTSLLTERGPCEANESSIRRLFPESF
jgi:methylthioribose-1-phosphate isomerase